MYCDKVGRTSVGARIKILETVMGSNQRLIQPQTVGKKAGAPMIWACQLAGVAVKSMGGAVTYKYPVQRLGEVGGR